MRGRLSGRRAKQDLSTPADALALAWDAIADLTMAARHADRVRYEKTLRSVCKDNRTLFAATLLSRYCVATRLRARLGREVEAADLIAQAWDLYPSVHRTLPATTVEHLRDALAMAFVPEDEELTKTRVVWFVGHAGAAIEGLASDEDDPLLDLRPAEALRWVLTKTNFVALLPELDTQLT